MAKGRFVVILMIITFMLRAALGLRDDVNLGTRLHEDDSFYLHTVSYFLGEGKGLTVDGIHPTNGIQPLIVVLNAPFYLISGGDKWIGLRLSFILSAIIDSLSVWLIYTLLHALRSKSSEEDSSFFSPPVIGCLLWTFLYPIILHTMNGMETSLYSMLLLSSLVIYTKHFAQRAEGRNISPLQQIGLGIVLGFTVLARVDAVILVIILLGFNFFYFKERNIARLFTTPFTSFVISSPWWVYNLFCFGNIIPTGGQAESIGGASLSENFVKLAVSFADLASVFFYLPFYGASPWQYPFWIIVVFGVVFFIARRFKIWEEITRRYVLAPVIPLLITGFVLAIFYTSLFHVPYFIPRYLQPLRIISILITSISVPVIVKKLRTMQSSRSILYSVFGIFFLFGSAIFSFIGYSHNFTGTGMGNFYAAGIWAKQHSESKIGMQQSGVASFMSDNIINMDGKVNADALNALKSNERGKYILACNITYIMDFERYAKVLVDEAATYGVNYRLFDSSGLLRMYKKMN